MMIGLIPLAKCMILACAQEVFVPITAFSGMGGSVDAAAVGTMRMGCFAAGTGLTKDNIAGYG